MRKSRLALPLGIFALSPSHSGTLSIQRVAIENGTLAFGVLSFFDTLVAGSESFLEGFVGNAHYWLTP